MKTLVVVIGLLVLAGGLAGCDSGKSSSDVPPLAPLAYTGVTTAANIGLLSVDQQKVLANSATRGVAVAIQYMQGDRGVVLDQLAVVMSKTVIATLAPPASQTELTNPAPCVNSQGKINYYARDTAGRYLVVDFAAACVPWVAGSASTEKRLILNGGLVIDSQAHTFTPDNLVILNAYSAYSAAVPVGSYELNGSNLSKLYFCTAGVCKIDAGAWDPVANNSYSTPTCSTPGCTPPASTIYDPTFGQVQAVAYQLLPCPSNLGAGLDSPFQSGTLTLTGAPGTGTLTITYSGCGQPVSVSAS